MIACVAAPRGCEALRRRQSTSSKCVLPGAQKKVHRRFPGNAAPSVGADEVGKLQFDASASGHARATPLTKSGPNTLGVQGTDSRGNGTPQAGRAAPS